ncbi:hypothetical protein DA01_05665 [Dehalococcoides mccartyi]|uniref:Uncharacterized protein n=1 Tax=Dehalococcoides mccartyi TaxID=61435 RepID=A0A0V8M3I0_9CHLR|nr:hypothetical protein DA01_05665 [Dehalococcoides mccartyi]
MNRRPAPRFTCLSYIPFSIEDISYFFTALAFIRHGKYVSYGFNSRRGICFEGKFIPLFRAVFHFYKLISQGRLASVIKSPEGIFFHPPFNILP